MLLKKENSGTVNGAVYLGTESKLILNSPQINFGTKYSTFLGRLLEYAGIHRDIGALPMLSMALSDSKPVSYWPI